MPFKRSLIRHAVLCLSVLLFSPAFVRAEEPQQAPAPAKECNCKKDIGVAVIRANGGGGNGAVAPRANTNVDVGPNFTLTFEQATITINAGDTVVWTLVSGFHTITDDGNAFDSGGLSAPATYMHQYITPGTYPYHCAFHSTGRQGMVGTIIVQAPPTPPVITNTPLTVNTVVGAPFSFTMTATGTPAPTLTYSNVPTVTNPNLNVNGATLSGSFSVAGSYQIGLKAANGVLPDDDAKMLTVEVNEAPHISSPLTMTTTVGAMFSYTLAASGRPAPTLSFTNVPGVLNTALPTISGMFTTPGTFMVGLHASNTIGNDDKSLVITVNQAPAISSALTASAIIGLPFTYTLTATGTPTPALSYPGGPGALPGGITQSGATISGTWNEATVGTRNIALQATNSVATDSKMLAVSVTAQAAATISSPLNVNAVVGIPFSYTLTATGNPAPAVSYPNPLPNGLLATGATISGTFNAPGQVTVALRAQSGATTVANLDNKTLTITIFPQVAPSITSPLSANTVVTQSFSYTLTALGAPAPALSFTTALPDGITATGATLSGAFTGSGDFNIGLHAENAAGSDDKVLVVHVAAESTPAITSPLNANAVVGIPFNYTLTASGVPPPVLSFPDPTLPGGIVANGATLAGQFSAAQLGNVMIALRAMNTANSVPNVDNKSLTVNVVPQAPAAITNNPLTAEAIVGEPFTFTLTASGAPAPLLSFPDFPAGFTITGATLSGTFAATGTVIVKLRAVNASNTDDKDLVITVNEKPHITSALTGDPVIGIPYTYTLTATGTPTPALSIMNVPSGFTLVNGDTLMGTFDPPPNTYTLFLSATNSAGTDDQTLVLNVTAQGAPVITSAFTADAIAGVSFSYTITATGNPAPALSFNNLPLPPVANLTATGGTLTGIFNTPGTYTIGLHAQNPAGMKDETLTVTVAPQTAPAITSALTATAALNTPFQYTITASGVPAPSFSFTDVPAGFVTSGAMISGTFSSGGTVNIGIHASNSAGTADRTLVVSVAQPPLITSSLSTSALTGSVFHYTLTASGFPAPALSFQNLPVGFTASNGALSGTFTLPGNYSIGLSASNGSGTDSQTLSVTVSQAPAITSPLVAAMAAESNFSYLLTAVGAPFPALSYSNLPDGLIAAGTTLSGSVKVPGLYQIGLHAVNSVGNDDKTLVLTVGTTPAISSALTASATAGAPFSYALTARSIPAATLTFLNLPDGLSAASGVLSGSFAADGTYEVGLRASNVFGADNQTLVVTVGAAPPVPVKPKLTSATAAISVAGADFSYALTADGTGPIAFAVGGLPPTLSFNGTLVSGTFPAAGSFELSLLATNAVGVDQQKLTVTVTAGSGALTATWNGTLKGKSFSQTAGSATSATLKGSIKAVFSQSDGNLAGELTIGTSVYQVKGKIGGTTLWLNGASAAKDGLTLSGHLDKKGVSIKGGGVVTAKNGAQEFTFALKKQ